MRKATDYRYSENDLKTEIKIILLSSWNAVTIKLPDISKQKKT